MILVFVAIAVISAIVGGGSKSTSGTDNDFSAKSACNDFVKARLKSPSTAHFNEDTVTHVGSGYTVSGTVDSENGFGASLRSVFTCEMTDTGDKWHLTNLDFIDGGDVN